MSRGRVMNSDKQVTAVKFNMKEQRCLQKNLVTLDAEASYSVKLIDMENRGMKVFYRRFRDKVLKIRSHLKVNDISRLKDLEATGRLSPPMNTVNTTAALRIVDAEKRLKIQGREKMRQTKSAYTTRSLKSSIDSKRDSVLSGSYEFPWNGGSKPSRTKAAKVAWDSEINDCSKSPTSSGSCKTRGKLEDGKSTEKAKSVDKVKKSQEKILPPEVEISRPTIQCTGISFVYGEPDQKVSAEKNHSKNISTESNQVETKSTDINDARNTSEGSKVEDKLCDKQVRKLSENFIETGKINSPRIMNKTANKNDVHYEPEATKTSTNNGLDLENNCNYKGIKDQKIAIESKQIPPDKNKDPSSVELEQDCHDVPSSNTNRSSLSNENLVLHDRNLNENKLKQKEKKITETPNSAIAEVLKPIRTQNSKKAEHIPIRNSTNRRNRQCSAKKHVSLADDGVFKSKTANDSPRSAKCYNKLAVPRVRHPKSASSKSDIQVRGRTKSSNSVPERRSISAAAGSSSNPTNMNRKYSCHNYDKEMVKLESFRSAFDISDGLVCFGDDPYDERRELMIMDEHDRFVIILHKKEEYLKRIEEYIRKQMEDNPLVYNLKGDKKKKRSPSEIWNQLKKCRYLRTEGENIDLSTVVTLASEQLKGQASLKYKPLFKRQRSKHAVIFDPEELSDEEMNSLEDDANI